VPARGTPVVGLSLSSMLSCLLVVAYYSGAESLVAMYTGITLLASLSALPSYVFAAGAEMLLAARAHAARAGERAGLAIAVGLAAFAYGVVTILGAGDEYVARSFLLLLLGMPFYVLARARQADRSCSGKRFALEPRLLARGESGVRGAA